MEFRKLIIRSYNKSGRPDFETELLQWREQSGDSWNDFEVEVVTIDEYERGKSNG